MAVSDRRMGASNAVHPERVCHLNLSSPDSWEAQITWGYIVNSNYASLTLNPPDIPEIDSYFPRLSVHTPDEGSDPFYKWRPKLPFTDQVGAPVDAWANPNHAWDFNEIVFDTLNRTQARTDYGSNLHEITLNDVGGYGVMSLTGTSDRYVSNFWHRINKSRADRT